LRKKARNPARKNVVAPFRQVFRHPLADIRFVFDVEQLRHGNVSPFPAHFLQETARVWPDLPDRSASFRKIPSHSPPTPGNPAVCFHAPHLVRYSPVQPFRLVRRSSQG
jgi:hypothetical protein